MLRTCATLILATATMMSAGGCGEKEEASPEEKFGADTQSVRKMLFRDGTVTRAISTYRANSGALPTTEQGLNALLKRPKGVDPKAWNGPYLDGAEDFTDMWGNKLHYRYPSTTHPDEPRQYDLWSLGPDGADGTDDDILNHQYR